jgi:hypothetical protein
LQNTFWLHSAPKQWLHNHTFINLDESYFMKSKILKGLIAMTIATTFSSAHAANSPSLK